MAVLKLGSAGPRVSALQDRLRHCGFNPGATDGSFGPATEAAVIAFQRSEGLLADGSVGWRTARLLRLEDSGEAPSAIPGVTVEIVSRMFPATPVENIRQNLPAVLEALIAPQLTEKKMVLMALATIRAETESFRPVSEAPSRYNSSPRGRPFDLYDNRRDLGNLGPPDGERFRGRGFIQLTGRANYHVHGAALGLGDQLVRNPELANDPQIAARLLASFLKGKEQRIQEALLEGELRTARKLVNGGIHGLDRFTETYETGERLIPEEAAAPVA
jgi:peptidoglycan L-alanyl-D-glutamate endopeptidase CwlK